MKNLILKPHFIFAAVLAAYLLLAGLTAATWQPVCDEAWFASPAYNLAHHGFFGTTVLDETATFRQVRLDGINQFTFWIMPLYSLVLAAWGAIVGFELRQVRLFSILCGAIALACWFAAIQKLTGRTQIALLAAALLAVDFQFNLITMSGRMDALTAAFGAAALAIYLRLREQNLDRAVLLSHAAGAAAFFTHPLALALIFNLLIATVYFDRRRVRVKHFALAAAPYLTGALLWSIYIAQNFALFRIQFGGNASDRWAFFRQPFGEIWRDVQMRYLYNFGISADLSFLGQIKAIVLATLLAGVVGVLLTPALRRRDDCRVLLLFAAQTWFLLLVLDSMKQWMYMIYILLPLAALLAVWIDWLWSARKLPRAVVAALVAIVMLVGAGTIALRARRDALHRNFYATAAFVNQIAAPDDVIFASGEFWFALARKENLIDDYRLGFRSSKKADFIIVDAPHYRDWTEQLEQTDTANYQFVKRLLTEEYALVRDDGVYQVYQRKR